MTNKILEAALEEHKNLVNSNEKIANANMTAKIAGVAIGALGGMFAANATPVTRVIVGLTAISAIQKAHNDAVKEKESELPVRKKSFINEMGKSLIGITVVSSLTNYMFGK